MVRERKLWVRQFGPNPLLGLFAVNVALVIAGSPTDPITRSLALDLERRGFIVYMLVGTSEDELIVQNEACMDIRARGTSDGAGRMRRIQIEHQEHAGSA